MAASDRGGFFGVTTKTLRLFLQSMMLGLGAWLAIHGEVTFGVIIAASILLGRALAPIDQAVGQWPLLQRALAAQAFVGAAAGGDAAGTAADGAAPPARTAGGAGTSRSRAPGARVPAVRGASFRLEPGPVQPGSPDGRRPASRRSRARSPGVWQPAAGSVRLDGAELDQLRRGAGPCHVG